MIHPPDKTTAPARRRPPPRSSAARRRGFTLVEILVALAVFLIALLPIWSVYSPLLAAAGRARLQLSAHLHAQYQLSLPLLAHRHPCQEPPPASRQYVQADGSRWRIQHRRQPMPPPEHPAPGQAGPAAYYLHRVQVDGPGRQVTAVASHPQTP